MVINKKAVNEGLRKSSHQNMEVDSEIEADAGDYASLL